MQRNCEFVQWQLFPKVLVSVQSTGALAEGLGRREAPRRDGHAAEAAGAVKAITGYPF